MRTRGIFGCIAVFGVLALRNNLASAAISYQYEFSQSNYTVAAGGTVNVEVFLQETGAMGDPFVLAAGGNGLTGTGVALGFGSVATVTSASNITGNAAFDNGGVGIATSLSSTSAAFTQSTLFNPPVTGVANGVNSYDLLLGTFTFTAQNAPGSEVVTAGRFNPALSEVITGSSAVLDGSIVNATATITIPGGATSVPELGTLGGGAICLLVCLAYLKFSSSRKPLIVTSEPAVSVLGRAD